MSPVYTKSSGEEVNTEEMATPYLERALAKAQRENNQANILALESELIKRGNEK